MALFFIIVAYIFAHLVIGGISYAKIQAVGRSKCRYKGTSNCDADCIHSFFAGVSTIFWPFVLPIMIGSIVGNSTKDSRIEARRAREIEEAEHQSKIAKLKAAEHEALDREIELLERKRRYDRLSKER